MTINWYGVINKMVGNCAAYCETNRLGALVVGMSGGLDSAVALALAVKVKKEIKSRCDDRKQPDASPKVIGISLPCYSSEASIRLAVEAMEKAGVRPEITRLDPAYDAMAAIIGDRDKVNAGNIKARLRMITLYDRARKENGMVLSTDNWSELMMGFWTLHGDVGDYGMFQNILKGTEMYEIAKILRDELGCPTQAIIDAKPDDGLGVTDQGDEGQLGASYAVVDKILVDNIRKGFDPANPPSWIGDGTQSTEMKILDRAAKTEYKRRGVVNLTREELGLRPIEKCKVCYGNHTGKFTKDEKGNLVCDNCGKLICTVPL